MMDNPEYRKQRIAELREYSDSQRYALLLRWTQDLLSDNEFASQHALKEIELLHAMEDERAHKLQKEMEEFAKQQALDFELT